MSSLIFVKSKFKFLDKFLFKIISSGDFTGIGACFTKKSLGSFAYVLSNDQPALSISIFKLVIFKIINFIIF